jgi:hypothetical protein
MSVPSEIQRRKLALMVLALGADSAHTFDCMVSEATGRTLSLEERLLMHTTLGNLESVPWLSQICLNARSCEKSAEPMETLRGDRLRGGCLRIPRASDLKVCIRDNVAFLE